MNCSHKCLGIQGIQGCGKSTLCNSLSNSLSTNVKCLSLDDFYYPHRTLGSEIRGHPNTHDIDLLESVLKDLIAGRETYVPIYDKTMYNGKGDRVGWQRVEKGTQLVILEGWCLGFTAPLTDESVVGEAFRKYSKKIYPLLGGIVVLDAPYTLAFEWREKAEKVSRDKGHGAMSSKEIKEFVDHYVPVYKNYEVDKDKILFKISLKTENYSVS